MSLPFPPSANLVQFLLTNRIQAQGFIPSLLSAFGYHPHQGKELKNPPLPLLSLKLQGSIICLVITTKPHTCHKADTHKGRVDAIHKTFLIHSEKFRCVFMRRRPDQRAGSVRQLDQENVKSKYQEKKKQK